MPAVVKEISQPQTMAAGDALQERLDPSRGSDSTLEIYVRYDIDLGAHQLARAFMALDGMYIVLSQSDGTNEWDLIPLRDRLSVSQIDTGNSITALFFGAATAVAGIAGLPIVAGAGAVATLAAWFKTCS
jgi:hypothetical protein